MLQQVWNGDGDNYVSYESACRCWRKADILLLTWNADINNSVGSTILAHSKNIISTDICNEFYNLMEKVKLKQHP